MVVVWRPKRDAGFGGKLCWQNIGPFHVMPLALRMVPVTAHRDRPLNGLASPPTSTALGSQVRSGSSWPLSGNCTEKQLPTDTPRPTASFGPCHRPRVPRRACVEPRPWSRQAPGGLPSGVWYTPEAAPLPARAGKEARGPLDSGSLPSRRSKPLSQPSAEIPVSWHLARSGTEEIGLFRALTF